MIQRDFRIDGLGFLVDSGGMFVEVRVIFWKKKKKVVKRVFKDFCVGEGWFLIISYWSLKG